MTAQMGGGSSNSTTNSSSQTHATKQPWGPTIDPLTQIIGLLSDQIGNYEPTKNENRAFDQLTSMATRWGNPFDAHSAYAGHSAYNLGSKTGPLQAAQNRFERRLTPFADGQHVGPDGTNPMLQSYLANMRNDITNDTAQMFAGAGRDLSGAHMNASAQGVAEGLAPVLAGQYNTDIQRQIVAANAIYNSANTTGAARTAAQMAGSQLAGQRMNMAMFQPNMLLDIEKQRRGLPIQNLGMLTSILGPLAQLGGTVDSDTTGTSNTSGSSSNFGVGMGGK
jgi:hypothetical protein